MRSALAGGLVGAILMLAFEFGLASHYTEPHRHIDSIHAVTDYEDFCVESSNTTYSWTTALQNIKNALWIEAPDDQEWDNTSLDPQLGGYRVFFSPHGTAPCQNLDPTERVPIEIEYWLWNNTSGAGCASPASCVGPWEDPHGGGPHVTEYTAVIVNLYAPYTVGAEGPFKYYQHQVNHETGHVLGFADGGGNPCPNSVMHTSFYSAACTDKPFPSSTDKSRLDALANP